MIAQWRKLQVIRFSKECCPTATRRRQALLCILAISEMPVVRFCPSIRICWELMSYEPPPAHLALEIQATTRLRLENALEDRVRTGVRERKSSMTSPIAHGPNRGRNHGVVQACGPTTRSLANTTFRRSHTTMSAASKRATIIAWGTLDGMKTVVNVNQRAVFVSIRTGIMTARDWSARPGHPERIGRPRRS